MTHRTLVLPFLLLGSCTVSTDGRPVESQAALSSEQCCSDSQPGRLPIFRFDESASYTTTIAATGDLADIYYPTVGAPEITALLGDRYPVVVLLQGGNTDKQYYAQYAGRVARFGFIVVVPNHLRPLFPGGPPTPLTEASVLNDGFAQAIAEGQNAASPIYGLVDESALGVTGHSFGGAVAINIIGHKCPIAQICSASYVMPPELKGAALYATNFLDRVTGQVMPVDTSDVPIALIQGLRDGRALPFRAEITYPELEPPRALIEIEGTNHYGINDVNNPAGATPDPNLPTISQTEELDRVGTWAGLFLRATISNDPIAGYYIFKSGGSLDGTVVVLSDK